MFVLPPARSRYKTTTSIPLTLDSGRSKDLYGMQWWLGFCMDQMPILKPKTHLGPISPPKNHRALPHLPINSTLAHSSPPSLYRAHCCMLIAVLFTHMSAKNTLFTIQLNGKIFRLVISHTLRREWHKFGLALDSPSPQNLLTGPTPPSLDGRAPSVCPTFSPTHQTPVKHVCP